MHGATTGDAQFTTYVPPGCVAPGEIVSVSGSQPPGECCSVSVMPVMPAPILAIVPQLPPVLWLSTWSASAPSASTANVTGSSVVLCADRIGWFSCWMPDASVPLLPSSVYTTSYVPASSSRDVPVPLPQPKLSVK